MSHSYVRIIVHLVWHTKHRERILDGRLEAFVLNEIRRTLDEFDLSTLAVNAAWDHVHTLAGWRSSVPVADVVQKAKGRTTYEWNRKSRGDAPELEWQTGYGALSVSPDRVDDVVEYIDAQKRVHQESGVIRRYEAVEESPVG